MGRKLTIEFEERTLEDGTVAPPFIRVSVDGEPLGVIARLNLEASVDDPFPKLEVDVAPEFTAKQVAACSPRLQETLSRTNETLRSFSFVTLNTGEGL